MLKTVLTIGLIATWAATALAGDYHSGGSLVCSDCHIMHASQSHGYDTDGGGVIPPFDGAAHESLLRNSVTELCLGCHDGRTGTADVMFSDVNGGVRAAGALNMGELLPTMGLAATGHTMGSTDVAPGGGWSNANGFTCTDCHEQHGYNPGGNAFRNMHYNPAGASPSPALLVTYATGGNNLDMDVHQVNSLDYAWDNVNFNEPTGSGSAYADFCKACHTDFHGSIGDPNMGGTGGTNWLRHPNADVDIGASVADGTHSSLATFANHTTRVKVMSQTGIWNGTAGDVTPACMTCHKAHGNQNAFGLIFMNGAGGTMTEEGDGGTSARDLCAQCHVQ